MATAWDAWPPGNHTPPHARSPAKSYTYARSPHDRSTILTARAASLSLGASPTEFLTSRRFSGPEASPPLPPVKLPLLPPELHRRIIAFALALPPVLPRRLHSGSPPTPEWDELAGRAARRAASDRTAQREAVARTARALLGVCKAWKPLVLKYLYAEPNVRPSNICGLAQAVVLGDRKWSNIHIHPHSYPGRWITTLDLSQLTPGAGTDDLAVGRALASLLDLAPALLHLKLPPCGVQFDDLSVAPCVRNLRGLEGVHLRSEADEEEVVQLLRLTKSLQVLGLIWPSAPRPTDEDEDVLARMDSIPDADVPPPITSSLDHLHTLIIIGGTPGPLLEALTRAPLPRVSRLVLSPYHNSLIAFEDDPRRGGPRALQFEHGAKIRSLTYVSTPGWPPATDLPARDTLAMHPVLVHLNLALPYALLHKHPTLATAFTAEHHPLSNVTIPRWPRVPQRDVDASVSPHPAAVSVSRWPAPAGNAFLAALGAGRSRITTIAVDGFTWVPPALGRWAAESGDSGMMRGWAAWLGRFGTNLVDMEGDEPPVIERGRVGWSNAMRRSVDSGGGRRSSDTGGGRRTSIEEHVRLAGQMRRVDGSDGEGGG